MLEAFGTISNNVGDILMGLGETSLSVNMFLKVIIPVSALIAGGAPGIKVLSILN